MAQKPVLRVERKEMGAGEWKDAEGFTGKIPGLYLQPRVVLTHVGYFPLFHMYAADGDGLSDDTNDAGERLLRR